MAASEREDLVYKLTWTAARYNNSEEEALLQWCCNDIACNDVRCKQRCNGTAVFRLRLWSWGERRARGGVPSHFCLPLLEAFCSSLNFNLAAGLVSKLTGGSGFSCSVNGIVCCWSGKKWKHFLRSASNSSGCGRYTPHLQPKAAEFSHSRTQCAFFAAVLWLLHHHVWLHT